MTSAVGLGASLCGLLDQAALASQRVPFWLLVTGLSLATADDYRSYTDYWLVSWLLTFLAGYGGGFSSAMLLQTPAVAAIGLFKKNSVGVFYTLSWWAILYCPGGWARRAYALPPVGAAARAARVVLRATTVVHRVDAAVRLHPGVVAAPIILGTIAGCGGRLLVDAFSHCAGFRQGPTELSHPGYSMRSAAVGALSQYVLVHVLGLLSSQQGLGLVISLYVTHSLACDLTGLPLDYTAPLDALFHKLTLIPEPGAAAASAAPATPAAAKRGKTPRTARGRAALAATQGAAGAAAGSSPARGAVESGPELWREEQDQEQLAPVRRTSRRKTLTDKKD